MKRKVLTINVPKYVQYSFLIFGILVSIGITISVLCLAKITNAPVLPVILNWLGVATNNMSFADLALGGVMIIIIGVSFVVTCLMLGYALIKFLSIVTSNLQHGFNKLCTMIKRIPFRIHVNLK